MKAYIRIFHTIPNAPAVDIYANNNLLIQNLNYGEYTDYLKVSPGNYNIKVYPTGKKTNPLINAYTTLRQDEYYTALAAGTIKEPTLIIIVDGNKKLQNHKANVRFAHLSPNTPNVDITLPDKTKLFSDIAFREITNYIQVTPGTYTLQARPAGTDIVALNIPNVRLKANEYYTIYAIGLLEGSPPLKAVILEDN